MPMAKFPKPRKRTHIPGKLAGKPVNVGKFKKPKDQTTKKELITALRNNPEFVKVLKDMPDFYVEKDGKIMVLFGKYGYVSMKALIQLKAAMEDEEEERLQKEKQGSEK